MDKTLLEKVKTAVDHLFKEKYDKRSTYHSFDHTREVAEAAEKIGKAAGLNDAEMEAVILAAWLHDVGYLYDKADHENQSAHIAEEILSENNYPEPKIQLVKENILATRVDHIPSNLMEEVLHDADYINLASPDNLKQSELLRNELVNYGGNKPTEEEWLTAELRFLLNHRYYTEYSRTKLEDKKSENIKKIKKKLKNLRKDEALTQISSATMERSNNHIDKDKEAKISAPATHKEVLMENLMEHENPGNKIKDDKKDTKKDKKEDLKEIEKKVNLAVKEFDTIYRLVATNHMRMNAIADRKANIMLSLNAIIISLTMGIVASSSEYTLRFIIPTSILIIVCLITIVFAALSTRPKVTTGTITRDDIIDKKANLLFFGNFSRMEYEDFDWGIRRLITDQEYLHNSMIQDFYNLGKVLDLKYKYLRICYNVFMIGIVLSVLAIPVLIALGF